MRLGLAFLLATLLLPLGAAAQDADALDQRARIHFQSGTAHYDAGDYEAALREFTAAYRLSERPALLYNIYLTQERLGNLQEALDNLRGYLESDEVPGDRRQVLTLRLENLERRLAAGDQEVEPAVDEAALPPMDTYVPTEDDTQGPPVTEPGADVDDGGGVPLPAIVAFGVGGVGAALWATFGILALTEDSSLEDECATRPCTEDDVTELDTYNTVADIGFAVTVVGATLGLVLMLTSGDDHEQQTLAVSPWGAPGAGGLAARGAF